MKTTAMIFMIDACKLFGIFVMFLNPTQRERGGNIKDYLMKNYADLLKKNFGRNFSLDREKSVERR